MNRAHIIFAILLLYGSSNAAEPPPLSKNPFSRPPSQITVDSQPQVLADGSVQELDLRATMAASTAGLANVAGKILRPGDEVQGYRLLKVFEDRAIFEREGKRLTIYVKPQIDDDDA